MVPFRPIEANNNGQMVPQAESIWERNYTNAAVARNATQMLTAHRGWTERFGTSDVDLPESSAMTHRFVDRE